MTQQVKNFIITALVGILFIFLAIAFIKNNIHPSTWSEVTRVLFILCTIGWIAMSSMIVSAIEDLK